MKKKNIIKILKAKFIKMLQIFLSANIAGCGKKGRRHGIKMNSNMKNGDGIRRKKRMRRHVICA